MANAKAGQNTPSFDGARSYVSPDFRDFVVIESVSRKLEDYAAVADGTPHPDTALFPNHRLVAQVEQGPENVLRYYAADRSAQDAYNFSIGYSEESNAHPIYTRDYLVRRSAYAPLTKLLPLSGIITAQVTAAGAGYVQATTSVTLSGGTGSGAVITPLVNNAGQVVTLVVTNPGTYTVAPTVTIVSTGAGAGATGTVAIEPQTAVLVKEDMTAKTGDERVDSLYVLVRRIYRTLPGPVVTEDAKYDEFGNLLTATSQEVVASAASGITVTAGASQEYKGIDSVRGTILTETYPDSFAQITEIEQVDPQVPGSRATIYTYLVDADSSIPDDTATTTYRRLKYEPNSKLKVEIKTVYAIPDTFTETDDNGHSFPEIFIFAVADPTFGTYSNSRPGFSRIVPCRVVHDFGTTRSTPVPTIVQEAEWHYPLGFSGHGLTDEEELTFVKDGSTVVLDLPPSTPSSSTYNGWIGAGTDLLVGGSSRIWHAGIYHTQTIYTPAL